MNGQSRQKEFPLQGKYVTLSLYVDAYYAYSGNRPRDHTLTGSAGVGRHNEIQLNLASAGAEWNYRNVIGRLSFQVGSMLNVVQDLDGSTARGRNLTTQNLRYIREATLGYHFDALHGINVEAGIFMSYIGLESYLLGENWNYNRSLVCEDTAFYFQGARAQIFLTKDLKIEPWLMNGWQTYGKWNSLPSVGTALRWSPREWLGFAANVYAGTDSRDYPGRVRFHHDNSVLVRFYQRSDAAFLSKAAFSVNSHAGFERGGGGPEGAYFLGTAAAVRAWFHRDLFAVTVRGEALTNPTVYLTQNPPPGLQTGEGADLTLAGVTGTFEIMPTDFFSVRLEAVARRGSGPYFAGRDGVTSVDGYQGGSTEGANLGGVKSQVLSTLGMTFRL
jgi:hypothetical protein